MLRVVAGGKRARLGGALALPTGAVGVILDTALDGHVELLTSRCSCGRSRLCSPDRACAMEVRPLEWPERRSD